MDQVTMTILMLVVCFGLMYFLTIQTTEEKEEELKQIDGNSGSWGQRVDNKRILRSCCR